ncbi:MAG: flagellar hook-basal body complex protein FliE [Chloroflexi bacterium]|nr:flagellar hook-basal body complex protein FliE [Chloroflexota bacterium]
MDPITLNKIQSITPSVKTQTSSSVNNTSGAFGATLKIQKLAAGENVDLHQVLIAAEQTDIAFRVALSMRDKLVEAYQEVMRMQV